MYESHDDHSITEGDVVIAADSDARVRDRARLREVVAIFPDIKQVTVTKQQGDDARVTFLHTDGNKDNVHFHNTPAARMIWFEDTGGRAEVWAEIVFVPGEKAGTTRVHYARLRERARRDRPVRQRRQGENLTHATRAQRAA